MDGKALLAKLLGTTAASTAAIAVAAGKAGLTADEQSAGTTELEGIAEKAFAEGKTAGLAEGRKAERERFGTVLTSEEATGRIGLAITQLSTTDNTPEQIIGCLKASPTVAETLLQQSAQPGAVEPQREAQDPNKRAVDPIAQDTPLVQPGQSGAAEDVDASKLWDGAFASTGAGVTQGGNSSVWNGLDSRQAN